MDRVIKELRAERRVSSDDDVAHLSPARFEHINPYGHSHFEPALAQPRRPLCSLRQP